MSSTTNPVIPEHKGVDIVPFCQLQKAKVFQVYPKDLEPEKSVHHLAYIPDFEQINKQRRYKIKELQIMQDEFWKIGYRLHLAEAIVDCVQRKFD